MLQLQDQFCNTKKGASSITEYCHTLKNLADDLKDVDSPITDIELVMQILRQLPPSYHSLVDVITNTKPFPSFLEAKNMLLLHESREASTESSLDSTLTQTAALFSSATNSGKSKNRWNKNRNATKTAPKGGGGGGHSSPDPPMPFAGILGNNPSVFGGVAASPTSVIAPGPHPLAHGISLLQQPTASQLRLSAQSAPTPQQAQLVAPPGPTTPAFGPSGFGQPMMYSSPGLGQPSAYPPHAFGTLSQPYYASPLPQYPSPQQPTPSFGGHAQSTPPQYTDIASVFQAMSIPKPPDNNYYMDSGASSHMSFNLGL